MGYCDFLYRKENIIGYTGDLKSNPTVYFVTESRDENGQIKTKSVTYGKGPKQHSVDQILMLNGHITQAHDEPTNVGRELVSESYSYAIANITNPSMAALGYDVNDQMGKSQEVFHKSETTSGYKTGDGFQDFHISRNPFVQVGWKDTATINELAKAIAKFPRLKARWGPKADDFVESVG